MLGHNPFYFKTIRNVTAAFGSIFNDIKIVRVSPNAMKTQTVNVALSYASSDKAFERRAVDPTLKYNMQGIFPRMAFNLVGINYDPTRKLTAHQNISLNDKFTFSPTPYDLEFELYIATANIEDGLQIVEQILPFFNPEFTLTTNAIPELELKKDVPIILNSVNYVDPGIDSQFTDFRIIEWTLSFTVKVELYGPIRTRNEIKHATMKLFTDLPFEETKRLENIRAEVDPITANKDEPHMIITTVELKDNV